MATRCERAGPHWMAACNLRCTSGSRTEGGLRDAMCTSMGQLPSRSASLRHGQGSGLISASGRWVVLTASPSCSPRRRARFMKPQKSSNPASFSQQGPRASSSSRNASPPPPKVSFGLTLPITLLPRRFGASPRRRNGQSLSWEALEEIPTSSKLSVWGRGPSMSSAACTITGKVRAESLCLLLYCSLLPILATRRTFTTRTLNLARVHLRPCTLAGEQCGKVMALSQISSQRQ
mmetsp:Transcript_72016/g.216517  ORF Transcript_72016/g.216517 Transcript_72016/m.216517 type:complete len:234 (-) Transcript_72016:145-846(-)